MKTLPALAALLVTASASAAQVWVAPASQKIRPGAQVPAGAPQSAQLSAARNEFEAFHVVVSGAASGVTMALEGLNDGAGHTISGRELTLYREALLNVTIRSGGDGAEGLWPDALVPHVDPIVGEKRNAFPFDVPANESRAVFVDVHVPQDAAPGVYQGTLLVRGGVSADVPVQLTVWDFDVPSTSTLKSAFGLAWNGPCVGHGDGSCSNQTAEFELRARYVQAALDNHVSIHTPHYESPAYADGREDWTSFDRYSGPFLDGTANTRLKGAKLTSTQVNGPMNATVVGAWARHFKAKGWFDRLFSYVCDEPPLTCRWSDIDGRIAQSRAGDPAVPTLVTTTSREARQQGLTQTIDLFTPVVNFMENKPAQDYAGNQRGNYGPRIWWYQSCMSFGCAGVGGGLDGSGETGWPSYAVDTDGTRNRAMEWMSFTYDVQGELYYETTMAYFTGDPWQGQYGFGGTGDGTLFYPGTPARIGGSTEIPVESLRLKGIRDGMEDYELLALAKKLGMGDQAKQIAAGVYPKTYQSTTSPAAIEAARYELAKLILHALGKDVPAPSGSALVSSASGGGCSTAGAQQLWLAVPLLALFALRRRQGPRAARAFSGPVRMGA